MFSIGEFSRASGITVKALRHYHEQGLLVPTRVDAQSGYRYYDAALLERARVLVYLRGLEFPLDEIARILESAEDDRQLLQAMERHRAAIDLRIKRLRSV